MKIITIDEYHTLTFLKEWLEWAEGGAVTQLYDTEDGLCCSSYKYTSRRGLYLYLVDHVMEGIFSSQDKSLAYPFGQVDYWKRCKEQTMHQCPNRL